MIDILARLQNAMHMESAAHSPRTTEAIEAMRAAQEEIERLQTMRNIRNEILEEAAKAAEGPTPLMAGSYFEGRRDAGVKVRQLKS